MYIVEYFKSFFEFNRLNQAEFLIRYLTLIGLSALIVSIDKRLLVEINSDFLIAPEYLWDDKGYFFKKLISFVGFVIFWLGLRRFKDILNVKSISLIPFLFFILLSLILSFYGFEMVLFILLLFTPRTKARL